MRVEMNMILLAFLLGISTISTVFGQMKSVDARAEGTSDWRFFLATNNGRLIREDTGWRQSYEGATEILYKWDTLHGGPEGPFSPNFGLEWRISADEFVTGWLLQGLQADRASRQWQRIDSLQCSFVYRLGEDAENYDTEPLLVIAYYGIRVDSQTGMRSRTLIDSTLISYDSYADFVSRPPEEDPELLRFPDVTGKYVHALARRPRSERYAIDYKRLGMTDSHGVRYTTIDCCLRRLQQVDVWVRGLRVTASEAIQ